MIELHGIQERREYVVELLVKGAASLEDAEGQVRRLLKQDGAPEARTGGVRSMAPRTEKPPVKESLTTEQPKKASHRTGRTFGLARTSREAILREYEAGTTAAELAKGTWKTTTGEDMILTRAQIGRAILNERKWRKTHGGKPKAEERQEQPAAASLSVVLPEAGDNPREFLSEYSVKAIHAEVTKGTSFERLASRQGWPMADGHTRSMSAGTLRTKYLAQVGKA